MSESRENPGHTISENVFMKTSASYLSAFKVN